MSASGCPAGSAERIALRVPGKQGKLTAYVPRSVFPRVVPRGTHVMSSGIIKRRENGVWAGSRGRLAAPSQAATACRWPTAFRQPGARAPTVSHGPLEASASLSYWNTLAYDIPARARQRPPPPVARTYPGPHPLHDARGGPHEHSGPPRCPKPYRHIAPPRHAGPA